MPVPVTAAKPYSIDQNLWHTSYEGGVLEDPATAPPDDMFQLTTSPEQAPDEPEDDFQPRRRRLPLVKSALVILIVLAFILGCVDAPVAAAICHGPGGALVDAAATMFSSMGEGFAAQTLASAVTVRLELRATEIRSSFPWTPRSMSTSFERKGSNPYTWKPSRRYMPTASFLIGSTVSRRMRV